MGERSLCLHIGRWVSLTVCLLLSFSMPVKSYFLASQQKIMKFSSGFWITFHNVTKWKRNCNSDRSWMCPDRQQRCNNCVQYSYLCVIEKSWSEVGIHRFSRGQSLSVQLYVQKFTWRTEALWIWKLETVEMSMSKYTEETPACESVCMLCEWLSK